MYPQGVCRIRKPAYAGNGCAIFLVFQTEEVGQKDGCGSQTQLRACCPGTKQGEFVQTRMEIVRIRLCTLNGMQFSMNVWDDAHIVPCPGLWRAFCEFALDFVKPWVQILVYFRN